MEVDLPPVTETPKRSGLPGGNGVQTYCSMPSKQYVAAAHPTGGHVTRLDLRHGNNSREDIFAGRYFREKKFWREDIFA